jgi:hypothetical protein
MLDLTCLRTARLESVRANDRRVMAASRFVTEFIAEVRAELPTITAEDSEGYSCGRTATYIAEVARALDARLSNVVLNARQASSMLVDLSLAVHWKAHSFHLSAGVLNRFSKAEVVEKFLPLFLEVMQEVETDIGALYEMASVLAESPTVSGLTWLFLLAIPFTFFVDWQFFNVELDSPMQIIFVLCCNFGLPISLIGSLCSARADLFPTTREHEPIPLQLY